MMRIRPVGQDRFMQDVRAVLLTVGRAGALGPARLDYVLEAGSQAYRLIGKTS